MEMDLLRAKLRESKEAIMVRFLHGLNREIYDVVELQNYDTLEKLVHQIMKVEMQLSRSAARRSNLEGKLKEKEKVKGEKSPKKGSELFQGRQEIHITTSPNVLRTSSIKCFKCFGKGYTESQCPNRRVIIVRDDKEVASESSHRETSTFSESESHSDDSHYKGDLLIVRRLMGSWLGDIAKT
ncbi:hypothetical protein CR513_03325, partial [Mucuna pruriens]